MRTTTPLDELRRYRRVLDATTDPKVPDVAYQPPAVGLGLRIPAHLGVTRATIGLVERLRAAGIGPDHELAEAVAVVERWGSHPILTERGKIEVAAALDLLEPVLVERRPISARRASLRYDVSFDTIARRVKAGTLTDLRPACHSGNAPLIVDENEISRVHKKRDSELSRRRRRKK